MYSKVSGVVLSDATVSYLETILWAETVSLPVPEDELVEGCMDVDDEHPLHGVADCEPLDAYFQISDFTVESLERAQEVVDDFFDQLDSAGLLDRANRFANDDRIAYDFWLTRQGHGAGFWDGDYADDTDDVGDALTEVAKGFGECYVDVGDDGQLYLND